MTYSPLVVEKNEGEIIDIGFVSKESESGPDGVNPFWKNPESLCIENEERGFIRNAFQKIESGKRKHKDIYTKLYLMMMSGDRAGKNHAEELNIPETEVASRVIESKKLFRKVIADICPEAADRWRRYFSDELNGDYRNLCLLFFLFLMKWTNWRPGSNFTAES